MSGSTILQILLLLQVFVMGVFAALAWRHARAHFSSTAQEQGHEQNGQHALQAPVELPADLKKRLLEQSQAEFQKAISGAAAHLQKDLDSTSTQVSDLVMRMATDVVSSEIERYKEDLEGLKKQSEANIGGIRTELSKHEEELKAKMAKELEEEKQKLIKQIDIKLADAVGSFLTETLQHNVDLGSQSFYLMDMLEKHKVDFIKEVGGENQPS